MLSFDDVTFIVWTFFLPIWLTWELWTLKKKKHPISVVARAYGYRFSAVIYFYASMPVHWWAPIPWPATTPGTVIFWIIQALLLGWNIAWWKRTRAALEEWPPWLRWVNWPVWYLALGPLAAAFLFPQRQKLPWLP